MSTILIHSIAAVRGVITKMIALDAPTRPNTEYEKALIRLLDAIDDLARFH